MLPAALPPSPAAAGPRCSDLSSGKTAASKMLCSMGLNGSHALCLIPTESARGNARGFEGMPRGSQDVLRFSSALEKVAESFAFQQKKSTFQHYAFLRPPRTERLSSFMQLR